MMTFLRLNIYAWVSTTNNLHLGMVTFLHLRYSGVGSHHNN